MSSLITSMIRETVFKIQFPTGLVLYPNQIQIPRKTYDVFINHRGVDTKEKEAGLVHDYLRGSGFHPFLDVESLKPGEKFADEIDEAVRGCKVGICIFSPRYGESLSCLNELVLLMETGKPLLPIFCDMEPSELRVAEYRAERCSAEQVKRFTDALEAAKGILGIRFKSATGNWSKLGRDTVEAVERIFIEFGEENPFLSYPILVGATQNFLKLSPWFRLVVENFLFEWWDLVEKGNLKEAADAKIHMLI